MEKNIPVGPFKSLVVLGESTVQGGGWLKETSERWADLLHRLLETAQEQPLRYHNAGLGASVISPQSPGYAASVKPSAMERLNTDVIAHSPDLLVIAYGLNDMRAGMKVENFRQEMVKLIAEVRKILDPLVVLVNVYYMAEFKYYPPFDRGSSEATQVYNAMLWKLAKELSCVYADVWSAEGGKEWVVHPDTVHANKIGNMLIAHKAFEAIVHAAPGIGKNIFERDLQSDWTLGCRRVQNVHVEES